MSKFTLVPKGTVVTTTGAVGTTQGTAKDTQLSLVLNVTNRNEDDASSIDVKIQHAIGAEDAGSGQVWRDLVSFAQVTGETANEVKTVTTPFGDKIRAYATVAGDDAAIAATLSTALTGNNNDLDYTADTAGAAGNSITVRYVDPAANNAALSVSVTGSAITVNLATDGAGAITSTAAQVEAAIEAHAPAAALVNVANKAGNDGTGVVTALAATNLAGGADIDDANFTISVHGVAKA